MKFDRTRSGHLFCIPHRYDLVIFMEHPEMSFWGDSEQKMFLNEDRTHTKYGEFVFLDMAEELFSLLSEVYHTHGYITAKKG
jgi:hypothetical protein